MRKSERAEEWVVYKRAIHGEEDVSAVCEQGEWDAMEREEPGHHILVRERISSEAEAEELARTGSGYVDGPRRVNKSKSPARGKSSPACQPLRQPIPGVSATPH